MVVFLMHFTTHSILAIGSENQKNAQFPGKALVSEPPTDNINAKLSQQMNYYLPKTPPQKQNQWII